MFLVPIDLNLGAGYKITATPQEQDIAVFLYKDLEIVGCANLVTDCVDVSCIMQLTINNRVINAPLTDSNTVGDAFFKFLIKFPSVVRKPEFRFVLDLPEEMASIASKHHFDQGKGTNIEDEILLREKVILPNEMNIPAGVTFSRDINNDQFSELLQLLKENAYWQNHLTSQRLQLLLSRSKCFFAFHNNKIIGFARVLTDERLFASLWDVVVEKSHQKCGIGTALMYEIFSDPILATITNWVIFTDTAKSLYSKFGFGSAKEFQDRKIIHKLRLQDCEASYMKILIQTIQAGLPIELNIHKSREFLFGSSGKREKLTEFWQSALQNPVENTEVVNESLLKLLSL